MPDLDPIERLEGLPDPVLAVDRGGRIAYVNPEAERLLAWPRADLVGRTLGEVVTGGAASARARRKDGAELVVDLLETKSGSLRVLLLRQIREHPEVPPHERSRAHEIDVRSEPGRGSVFRVSLPGSAAQPQSPAAEKPAPPPTGRRPRLLLIDDEAHLGITLTAGLREAVDVVSVRGGREAVRLLASDQEFDLILCDLMMPDLTGMDVYEEVSRKRPELGARFVFMTGGPVTERARRFLEQVPRQRLDKPFRLEQVESLLHRPAV